MTQKIIAIKPILETKDLEQCFSVIRELRPDLNDCNKFVSQIMRQQVAGYQMFACIANEYIVGCIGYRHFETLAWGRILYIDDLIISSSHRKNGYANTLLDYAINYAKSIKCAQVHLDSGYTRYDAHKLYLKYGFQLNAHHIALQLN
jgi:GNAT superfamily N-acetyltransferase